MHQSANLTIRINYTSTNLLTQTNMTMADIKTEDFVLEDVEKRIEKLLRNIAYL